MLAENNTGRITGTKISYIATEIKKVDCPSR